MTEQHSQPHPTDNTPVVTAHNLTKVYGDKDTQVHALDGVSTAFTQGSFTAIMGPSGSGKSTFMHCLAGLDKPTSGQVTVAGQRLDNLDDNALTTVRRDQIGFIFQSFNLLPTHTAKENILLPLELSGRRLNRSVLNEIVESLGLTGRLNHLPSQLSGGEQQRVAIARALVARPAVIFADEPTGALDSRNSVRLLKYLEAASLNRGQTIIMVTHDPRAAHYVDRALILSDGKIRHDISEPTSAAVVEAMNTMEVES
jgi:putative ABC transport system ATP-binding protein